MSPEQSHRFIQDNRDLVLDALDGDTTALGNLLAKAVLAGQIEAINSTNVGGTL